MPWIHIKTCLHHSLHHRSAENVRHSLNMNSAIQTLLNILNVTQIDDFVFMGQSPDDRRKRIFGGQFVAQALMAAGRSSSHEHVHSLHAYFLHPGRIDRPIRYEVNCIKDGKNFSNFQVTAFQEDTSLFVLLASFHNQENGLSHQLPMPDAPNPLTLPTLKERMKPWENKLGDWNLRLRPFDQRYVEPPHLQIYETPRQPNQRLWVKAYDVLPDDPLIHAGAFAFASDSTLIDSVLLPHKLSIIHPRIQIASLDHSIWFHRPFRCDHWFLYDQESPAANAGRALTKGHIFTEQGLLAASVVQEVLIRVDNLPE